MNQRVYLVVTTAADQDNLDDFPSLIKDADSFIGYEYALLGEASYAFGPERDLAELNEDSTEERINAVSDRVMDEITEACTRTLDKVLLRSSFILPYVFDVILKKGV